MSTKNWVPRANGEGGIGTEKLKWGSVHAVNGDIDNYDSAIGTLDSAIGTLQTKVTTLEHAYAGAKAAATVAKMTDHNQIYVYVGSESGYTNGNWYYWNGTAWTSGGVYNATALETDKTLTVSGSAADAQAAGLLIEHIKELCNNEFINIMPDSEADWVDGFYLGKDGEPTENSDYTYESKYINCFGVDKVIGSIGFCFVAFYDKNKTFLSSSNFSSRGVYEVSIPSNATYMRFSWVSSLKNSDSFVFFCSSEHYKASRLATNKTNIPLSIGREAIWGNGDSTITIGQITDANDIITNSSYIVQGEVGTKIANLPDGFANDGSPWILKTYAYACPNINPRYLTTAFSVIQVFKKFLNGQPAEFVRTASPYIGGTGEPNWKDWIPTKGSILECGAGKMFTTLKEAILVATRGHNVTVVVYPGTYNLNEEFADEIASASGTVGNELKNNIYLKFLAGSFVTVSFEPSNSWAYHNFSPFHAASDDGEGYTIDGLNIYAKNAKYCVHDEMGGHGVYKHVYKNCVMEYENTVPNPHYVQCIGGGLGRNGLIYIEGGYYKSTPTVPFPHIPNKSQQPITYHNGETANIESKIFISNVYLADEGYFRFGWYGPSTIKSKVYISGCRMGYPTLVAAENSSAQINNFEVYEWGNTIIK